VSVANGSPRRLLLSTKTFLPGTGLIEMKRLVTVLCLCTIVLCGACAPSISKLEKKGDVEGLVAILADSTATLKQRAEAARSLGNIGSPLAVEALIRAMQEFFEQEAALFQGSYQYGFLDVDEAVSATADALGQIGDPRAVDPLISVLETINKDPETYDNWGKSGRDAVARALGKLGDAKAVMPLFESAAKGCWHVDDCASWAAVQALGAPTIEMLMDALPSWRNVEDSRLYGMTLEILAEGTDPRIRTALETELKAYGNPHFPSVVEALAQFLRYDPDQLLPYLESEDTVGMFYAFLIELGIPGTEPALIAALNRFGDEYTAKAYYLCGNDALEEAAKRWFSDRDLRVFVDMPSGPVASCGHPCWGERAVGP